MGWGRPTPATPVNGLMRDCSETCFHRVRSRYMFLQSTKGDGSMFGWEPGKADKLPEFPRFGFKADGSPADKHKALNDIYEYVERYAATQWNWYKAKTRLNSRRVLSLWIRVPSLLFFLLGGLCPLLPAETVNKNLYMQWGYFLIALGAGFLLLDRRFGVSSSWMRFIMSPLQIGRHLNIFRTSWTKTRLLAANSPDEAAQLLSIAEETLLAIHNIVIAETNAWSTEFDSNLAQQYSMMKGQSSYQRDNSAHPDAGRHSAGKL
jgi:SMODS and SLOG-associating 2TM effector domain 2